MQYDLARSSFFGIFLILLIVQDGGRGRKCGAHRNFARSAKVTLPPNQNNSASPCLHASAMIES